MQINLRQFCKLVLIFIFGFQFTLSVGAPLCNNVGCFDLFKGAWFEIYYPSDFIKMGSKSATSSAGNDAAIFIAPDKSVEFYIYSPQWGGLAPAIEINSKIEKLDAEKRSKTNGGFYKWTTISALNGGYMRSYQGFQSDDGKVNWVIGIKYKDMISYSRYKDQYLFFKRSLKQFSD